MIKRYRKWRDRRRRAKRAVKAYLDFEDAVIKVMVTSIIENGALNGLFTKGGYVGDRPEPTIYHDSSLWTGRTGR